jgi:hypothetical protein
MSNFDTANKIKFAMGSSQAFTISNWEQTQFGMKYNTSDGRFFDASKGLTDLLQEMNIGMNTPVTIEKRSNPSTKPGQQDYGMFFVNNLCLADVRNGAQPQVAQPANGTSQPQAMVHGTPAVAPQPQATPVATSDTESRLSAIEARLSALEGKNNPVQNGDLPF